MPEVIYKYPLAITDVQTIEIPANATFLSVINQNDVPVVYARVDLTQPIKTTTIHMYGTGNPIPMHDDDEFYDHYIGTVALYDEALVFHVYEAVSYDDMPF